MKQFTIMMNLNRFDEDGADQATNSEAEQEVNTSVEGEDTEMVVTDGDDNHTEEPSQEDKFEELIKGDYKDIFGNRVQKIIDGRFKDHKQLESDLEATKSTNQRVTDALIRKYNVTTLDEAIEAMTKESDESIAYDKGVPVEEITEKRLLKEENEKLKQQNSKFNEQNMDWAEQQKFQAQVKVWREEEVKVKEMYPDFDLTAVSANKDFASLVKSGVKLQQAYEVIFPDKLTARIQGKLQKTDVRPKENVGDTKKQEFKVGTKSVSELTKAERAELAKRAAHGETIKF